MSKFLLFLEISFSFFVKRVKKSVDLGLVFLLIIFSCGDERVFVWVKSATETSKVAVERKVEEWLE